MFDRRRNARRGLLVLLATVLAWGGCGDDRDDGSEPAEPTEPTDPWAPIDPDVPPEQTTGLLRLDLDRAVGVGARVGVSVYRRAWFSESLGVVGDASVSPPGVFLVESIGQPIVLRAIAPGEAELTVYDPGEGTAVFPIRAEPIADVVTTTQLPDGTKIYVDAVEEPILEDITVDVYGHLRDSMGNVLEGTDVLRFEASNAAAVVEQAAPTTVDHARVTFVGGSPDVIVSTQFGGAVAYEVAEYEDVAGIGYRVTICDYLVDCWQQWPPDPDALPDPDAVLPAFQTVRVEVFPTLQDGREILHDWKIQSFELAEGGETYGDESEFTVGDSSLSLPATCSGTGRLEIEFGGAVTSVPFSTQTTTDCSQPAE